MKQNKNGSTHHDEAAFHHETAAHHHRQAAKHRTQGDHDMADRHTSAADRHSRMAYDVRHDMHYGPSDVSEDRHDRDRPTNGG